MNLVSFLLKIWALFWKLVPSDLQACTKRVEDDDTGSKHCTGQYFDYWGCIDKCVSKSHSFGFPLLESSLDFDDVLDY